MDSIPMWIRGIIPVLIGVVSLVGFSCLFLLFSATALIGNLVRRMRSKERSPRRGK